ncbi:hypothetical protein SBF1_780007 [Candidatus Desulfosporosinus infrequens]|uniref:Uncharacterized protein n=1 Tax=Candidatus Desulfosporosinus infrequens TaxID=2043169 RepID=A0A2U3LRV2_9FIRM|nr:hypothetical protein SBF1_780007 [Candidatus Desulfosporosinus infrequens]
MDYTVKMYASSHMKRVETSAIYAKKIYLVHPYKEVLRSE